MSSPRGHETRLAGSSRSRLPQGGAPRWTAGIHRHAPGDRLRAFILALPGCQALRSGKVPTVFGDKSCWTRANETNCGTSRTSPAKGEITRSPSVEGAKYGRVTGFPVAGRQSSAAFPRWAADCWAADCWAAATLAHRHAGHSGTGHSRTGPWSHGFVALRSTQPAGTAPLSVDRSGAG